VLAAACPSASASSHSGRVADHWSWIVWEDAGHLREVADIAVDHAEEREDGGLVGRDAVEVAHVLAWFFRGAR
jgi:hypothetical protein